MMDASTIIDLVANNGVAIAMLCYFIWDKNHYSDKMSEAVNNNNTLLQKLIWLLGKEDEMTDE